MASIKLRKSITPAPPNSGYLAIYAKADNLLYTQTDAGAEAVIGGGGGSMLYPAAGIPVSTGVAWAAPLTTIGSGTVLVLANAPTLMSPVITGGLHIPGGGNGVTNETIGTGALTSNTTGFSNTAIGYETLFANTTGLANAAFGRETLKANIDGAYNTGLGTFVGTQLTHGSYNTFVGAATGLGITTGNGNTVLGAGVGGLAANLTNNIIIANGTGAKARHDGTSWVFTPNIDSNNLSFLQAGAGAVARTVQSRGREDISVVDFGADATGAVNSLTAFTAAITALPATGGKIKIPTGTWNLSAVPTWGSKSIFWDIDVGAVFTGAGTVGLSTFPNMHTNIGQKAVGPWIQSRAMPPTGTNQGVAALNVEMLQPASAAGNSVGIFAGSYGSGTSANANNWVMNTVLQDAVGAAGSYFGFEMDFGRSSAASTMYGIVLTTGGSYGPQYGLEINGIPGWITGVHIDSAVTGLSITNPVTVGIQVGAAAVPNSTSMGLRQLANNATTTVFQRFTDTLPTGSFLYGQNAANTQVLFVLDVFGNFMTTGNFYLIDLFGGAALTKAITFGNASNAASASIISQVTSANAGTLHLRTGQGGAAPVDGLVINEAGIVTIPGTLAVTGAVTGSAGFHGTGASIKSIDLAQTMSVGPAAGSTGDAANWNDILVTDTTGAGGSFYQSLKVTTNLNSGANGNRNAVMSLLNINTDVAASSAQLVALTGQVIIDHTSSHSGNAYAANLVMQINSGKTGWQSVSGLEVNTAVSAATTTKTGIQIVDQGTVVGGTLDAGLAICSGGSSSGYTNGIYMGSALTGYAGVIAGGTYINCPNFVVAEAGNIELGKLGSSNTPYIDFHSSSTSNDYDVRLLASGGDTSSGHGTLAITGVFLPVQAATGSAPAYIKGGMYFDTTLNKIRIGGATAWETVTSA